MFHLKKALLYPLNSHAVSMNYDIYVSIILKSLKIFSYPFSYLQQLTYAKAHAFVNNHIFNTLFSGSRCEFGIILNDFGSFAIIITNNCITLIKVQYGEYSKLYDL